jgi:hypothetical protein
MGMGMGMGAAGVCALAGAVGVRVDREQLRSSSTAVKCQ